MWGLRKRKPLAWIKAYDCAVLGIALALGSGLIWLLMARDHWKKTGNRSQASILIILAGTSFVMAGWYLFMRLR